MTRSFGKQGFSDAEAAKRDAANEIKVTERTPFAVMRKGTNYGWLFPVSQARKVAEASDVEIVEYADLIPPSAKETQ